MDKPIRKVKQDKIVWKDEKRLVCIPYCPVCKKELHESGKDYRPYWCKCGDWYWNEKKEEFGIYN